MKKQVGIVIAVVATVLTMGVAFAIQHYASAAQPVSEQVVAKSKSSSRSVNGESSAKNSEDSVSKKPAQSVSPKESATSKKRTNNNSEQSGHHSKRESSVTSQKKVTTATSNHTSKRPTKKTAAVVKTPTKAIHKTGEANRDETVHLKVSGYKKTFFNGTIKINSKSTAFSVLQDSKLKLVYQNGVAVYVSSINGLAENQIKVGSGWKYHVNGKFIDRGANKEPVSNHDTVHWYFTTKGY